VNLFQPENKFANIPLASAGECRQRAPPFFADPAQVPGLGGKETVEKPNKKPQTLRHSIAGRSS
jgi:hypothetical protein